MSFFRPKHMSTEAPADTGHRPVSTSTVQLQAEQITVGYGQVSVLHQLSFQAAPEKLTVLVGPNGCGKSTLLKALARALRLRSGQVTLAGKDVHHTNTREIARQLAFLPQGPIAPEGLCVEELVAQGRFPHQSLLKQWSNQDATAVAQALRQTNLTALRDRPVASLSGGQRQRAWIAMVLAQDTPVLLLDEPTAFLDLKVQIDVLALLQQIAHQESRTVVVVLHDLNLAAQFADHMVMIRKGKICVQGHINDVFTADNLKAVFDLDAHVLHDPASDCLVCVPQIPAQNHIDEPTRANV